MTAQSNLTFCFGAFLMMFDFSRALVIYLRVQGHACLVCFSVSRIGVANSTVLFVLSIY